MENVDISNLTDKQQLFCIEYLIDLNASQAARRAGYAPDTSHKEGSRLLTNVGIRAYIQQQMSERSKKTMIDAEYVVEKLKEVEQRCRQATPVMKFNFATQMMEQVKDEDDNNVWQFDSQGANKALELLGKHLAIFTEKQEISGELGGQISEDRYNQILATIKSNAPTPNAGQ